MNEEESERKAKEVSKGGRVVQGGSLRYCSLRRRGFEPHPLHFYKRQQGQEYLTGYIGVEKKVGKGNT